MLLGLPGRTALVVWLCASFSLRAQNTEDKIDQLHSEAAVAERQGDLATAIAKYQAMLKLDPSLGAAYNNLGALYFKQGNLSQAAETLEHGLKIDPKMSSAAALLGITYFQMAEYAKARTRLEAAVRANSSDANAELYLVNTLIRLSDFDAAADHLKQLAVRQPRNQHVWYLLGRVYMQLSQQALGKINEIDPNSVWAHEIAAELMEDTKNISGAIEEWKKAVEAAPNQPGVHLKLGDLYWSLSQWDNATEQFKLEQQIDPHNCQVDYKLGDILMRQDVQVEQALALVDKAVTACPNLVEARADRGRLLLKLHREQEAIADLQAVEKSDPSEPSTHFLLAQAYRTTGMTAEAQSEMKSFSELEAKARAATAQRAQDAIKDGQAAH
jgi:tetratricopeptide (TPR) repeat protein